MDHGRVVRDPVHGYVELPDELAVIVDTPAFQRLRRIAQTSLASSVYPSATGSRFEHALGAMHLAAHAWDSAWANADEIVRTDLLIAAKEEVPDLGSGAPGREAAQSVRHLRLAVAAVGLLHDVGHPPFSHVLEPLFAERTERLASHDPQVAAEWRQLDGAFHERAGVILTRRLAELLPDPLRRLLSLVYEEDPGSGSWKAALHGIVAGEIDTDRLDYLMRDAQRAGTEFGAIDAARLVASLQLIRTDGDFRVVPSLRARSAFETLLIQRAQAYRWVAFHPRVVAANLALARAAEQLLVLAESTDPVTASPSGQTGKDFFGALVPNLNYLWPSAADVELALSPLDVRRVVPGWRSDGPDAEKATANATRATGTLAAAGVDDATVIEAIKKAILVSRLASSSGPSDAVRRMVTYGEAALFREKNFVVAWKTPEEYEEIAVRIVDSDPQAVEKGLRDIVGEAYTKAAADAGSATTREGLEVERNALLGALDASPAGGLNRIVQIALATRASRERLRARVEADSTMPRDIEGFWDVNYSGFSPIKTGAEATILWDGNAEVPLVRASPIVAELGAADEKRPWLTGFFFAPGIDFRKWSHEETDNLRGRLRRAFAVALAAFLTTELRDALP